MVSTWLWVFGFFPKIRKSKFQNPETEFPIPRVFGSRVFGPVVFGFKVVGFNAFAVQVPGSRD